MAVEEEDFKALQKQVLENIGIDIKANQVVNTLISRVLVLEQKREVDRKLVDKLNNRIILLEIKLKNQNKTQF